MKTTITSSTMPLSKEVALLRGRCSATKIDSKHDEKPQHFLGSTLRLVLVCQPYDEGVVLCHCSAGISIDGVSSAFHYDNSATLIHHSRERSQLTKLELINLLGVMVCEHRYDIIEVLTPAEKRAGRLQQCLVAGKRIPLSSPTNAASSFLLPSFDDPVQLLSLSLVRNDGADGDQADDVLFQSCVKRQLAGMHIAFLDSTVSTELAIHVRGTDIHFQVTSLVARTGLNKKTPIFYVIVPNTRISIRSERTPQVQSVGNGSLSEIDRVHPRLFLSYPAELLLDTIDVFRHCPTSTVTSSFLLTGPPGVGKTFAVQTAVSISQSSGPTLLVPLKGSDLLGSENTISKACRSLEQELLKASQKCQEIPSCVAVIFLDECDALLSNESVANVLARFFDRQALHLEGQNLLIVAATNRIDCVPSFLRRPGRFDKEIALHPPNSAERSDILESLLRRNDKTMKEYPMNVLTKKDINEIAEACIGYVPADLQSLLRSAYLIAIQKGCANIRREFLEEAMTEVGASALRDNSVVSSQTGWDDVVGDPGGAKTIIRDEIERPKHKIDLFRSLDISPPRGILLYGPPGTAKTTLARATAGSSHVAFVTMTPADVYSSSYVGEAENVVRKAFASARATSPCILFFDEIDAIFGSGSIDGRGMGSSRGSSAEARVLSTFLNEMDGVDVSSSDRVTVVGATNRPWMLDKALLRPGRFDKLIYVSPPDFEGRRCIFEKYLGHFKASGMDFKYLASEEISGNMTGAEIIGACKTATMKVLQKLEDRRMDNEALLQQVHIEDALREIKPLMADQQLVEQYRGFADRRRLQ